jgi:hypothetical protein
MSQPEDSLDRAGHLEIARFEKRLRTDDEIDELVHESAGERVLALAVRHGWRVFTVTLWCSGWLRCQLKREIRLLKSASHPLLE